MTGFISQGDLSRRWGGRSRFSIWRDRKDPAFPPPVQFSRGGAIYFRLDEIEAFEQRRRDPQPSALVIEAFLAAFKADLARDPISAP